MKHLAWSLSLLMVGCSVETQDAVRIEVGEDNGLGVVALEVQRSVAGGERHFELRGVDVEDAVVARVTLHTGEIADIEQFIPGADLNGTEITVATGDIHNRIVTRETEYFALGSELAPELLPFLQLEATRAQLATANIHLDATSATSDEVAFMTGLCPASYLLTTPVAAQCCYNQGFGGQYTLFVNPAGAIVKRVRNQWGSGAGCKAQDGTSACSGSACYFGPNGFARATVTTGSGYARVFTTTSGFPVNDNWCNSTFTATPQTPVWPNATGTFPTNQGCPGGGSSAGLWDY